MQVFKTYFKILKKQLVPISIYAVMFLVLTIVITKNIKVENQQFFASKVKTMVINEDGNNEFIEGFLDYLGQYVTFIEPEKDEDARKDALFFQKTSYILTIPKGFTESFVSNGSINLMKETAPNSIEAISVDNAVNNYLNMAKNYLKFTPNISYRDLNNYIQNSLSVQTPVTIEIKTQDEVTYSNGFNRNYFNYLGYIIISSFVMGVSIVMYSFNETDILRKHSAAPISSRNLNFQLILANLIYVFAYMILFVAAGYILNRDRMINANTLLTWLNAAVFAITILSISYLIGISIKSKKAVQAVSTALSLSLAFISGIFVPQEFLGAPVLKAASFAPAYWYVKANGAIEGTTSLHWSELSNIFGYMAIQLGFAAAFISIALVVSKRKSERAY